MGRHRRKNRAAVPVRTGLLGVSAAVAVGAVAVASGLVPVGDTFTWGESGSERVSVEGASRLSPQGGASATPSERPSATATGGTARAASPTKGLSSTSGKASPTASKTPAEKKQEPKAPATKKSAAPRTGTPERKAPARSAAAVAPAPSTHRKPPTGEAAAEAAVLALVNEERAKVGCSPVRPDGSLGALAGAFSADMASRGFFDHTDPDGATPWDRAAKAGVSRLGGENIARGQADAATVMNSWMSSEGHRANILNCSYRTLGVGVSFADGGPWWTQDFGY
ncbi:CAP domain-containing protein [Streptomyces sp. NPDC059176]|uniref:CAP domain-containing protein n=1 Tax=unclassified Streptomyces TaxID=2593676 RepID=UPI0036BE3DCE